MVNKLEGMFTEADEEAFEVFSVYCGLALHNAKVANLFFSLNSLDLKHFLNYFLL